MINLKFTRQFAALAIATSLFASCSKVDKVDPVDSPSQTIVSIVEGGTPGLKKVSIDFVKTPITIVGAEIRRELSNQAGSNANATFVVTDDTAAVSAARLTPLPASLYSVGQETPKTGGAGGIYTVSMKAGEVSKAINITIPDATLLNPAVAYGVGFTIQSVDGSGAVVANKTLVVEIGAKSSFDGRYQLKGFHSRTSPVLNDSYDEEVYLITTGANSVKMYWPALGVDAHPIHAGTTYYSNFTTEFSFNPSTNALSSVENTYNRTATPFTIASTTSRYDPSTKTIYAQYYYNNNTGRMFTDTLVYIGSR